MLIFCAEISRKSARQLPHLCMHARRYQGGIDVRLQLSIVMISIGEQKSAHGLKRVCRYAAIGLVEIMAAYLTAWLADIVLSKLGNGENASDECFPLIVKIISTWHRRPLRLNILNQIMWYQISRGAFEMINALEARYKETPTVLYNGVNGTPVEMWEMVV